MNSIFRKPFCKFMDAIQPDKKVAPGEPLRIAGEGQVALMNSVRIKFVDVC